DGTKYTGFAKVVDGVKAIARAAPGVGLVGGALDAIGVAIGTLSAPVLATVGASVAALAIAGYFIWKYWDRLSSIFGGVARRIGEELQPALEAAKPLLDGLGEIGKTISEAWTNASTAIGNF